MKSVVYQDVLEDLKDLETALTAIDERKLQEADAILIYLNGRQWMETTLMAPTLEEVIKGAQQQARERLAGKALYFAPDPSSFARLEVHPKRTGSYRPLRLRYLEEDGAAFEALPDADLVSLMAQATCAAIEDGRHLCVVNAPAGLHFELPSKSHASHFIRLSEAFDCIEAVQRVAYWIVVSTIQALSDDDLLPDHAFLVDHPTMLLLGTHVNLIYGGAHQVLTLRGYPSEASLRADTSRLLQKMNARGVPVTAIIGIASTGKLARLLQELADATSAILDVRVVFAPLDIYGGPQPMARLEIPGYFHSVDAASCGKCGQGAPQPIQVHSRSFLLSLSPAIDVPLKPIYFEQQRAFIDRYGAETGVLRVHFDDPNEVHPRHHAFGIDATALLANTEFRQEVITKLSSLDPKPDLVVIPNHNASGELRATIARWDQVPVVTVDELDTLQGKLPKKPTILVFDDKVVSGQRLRNMNVSLREPRIHLWEGFNHLHFFAPIVTPKSEKQLDELRKGLTTHHHWTAELHYLYCVCLPDWHTSADCPWCNEEKLLRQLASESNAFDSALTERLALLGTKEQLDAMGCLAPNPDVHQYPALGNGSLAGSAGASQLQVLIATASAVQQLRSDPARPLDPHSMTQPTKMARFVFEDAFTEKLIACSILRSLGPAEVSDGMRDYLIKALQYPEAYEGTGVYQIELSIALMGGKMGTVNDIATAWNLLLRYGVSDSSLRKLGFNQPTVE